MVVADRSFRDLDPGVFADPLLELLLVAGADVAEVGLGRRLGGRVHRLGHDESFAS